MQMFFFHLIIIANINRLFFHFIIIILDNNNIGDKGAKALAEALAKALKLKENLTYLDLGIFLQLFT